MLIIPLNLDSVLLLLHNSKLAYFISLPLPMANIHVPFESFCAFQKSHKQPHRESFGKQLCEKRE